MALFGFRTRRARRDQEADAARLHSLLACLSGLAAEIDRERAGLRERVDRVRADAAFSMQAIENDGLELFPQVERMTAALNSASARLRSLHSQAVLIAELRRRAGGLRSAGLDQPAYAASIAAPGSSQEDEGAFP